VIEESTDYGRSSSQHTGILDQKYPRVAFDSTIKVLQNVKQPTHFYYNTKMRSELINGQRTRKKYEIIQQNTLLNNLRHKDSNLRITPELYP